ncbi:MAG TPA: hypothetical protein VMT38_10880 [Terracidiphilus sp.]|nr:hypothetical protein [Terracidiphilus sp.]
MPIEGGTAGAAVLDLVEQGANLSTVNRTHEKAADLARKARAHLLKQNVRSKQRLDAISTPRMAKQCAFGQPYSYQTD